MAAALRDGLRAQGGGHHGHGKGGQDQLCGAVEREEPVPT